MAPSCSSRWGCCWAACPAAQTVPAPVPADEVFSREQIGHALSAPTPRGRPHRSQSANAPADDGQWTMPSKNYASTRFSGLTELTPQNVAALTPGVLLFARA